MHSVISVIHKRFHPKIGGSGRVYLVVLPAVMSLTALMQENSNGDCLATSMKGLL